MYFNPGPLKSFHQYCLGHVFRPNKNLIKHLNNSYLLFYFVGKVKSGFATNKTSTNHYDIITNSLPT